MEDPSRIFNGDETSFSLSPKTGNVLAPKGWKNLYTVKAGNEKETITVLFLFSAAGQMLPPLVVFPYVRPPQAVVRSMPDKWVLGRSESGWMRSETFFEYVANSFNEWLTENNIKRPVLLLVDGHKSHLSMELSEFCRNNDIILYALLPNTTHITQPADVGAFKGLKTEYKRTVHEWQNIPENRNKAITKVNFCRVLEMVLSKSDRTEIIQNSFRKCGLYPFNPDAVDYSKCVQNQIEMLSTEREIVSLTNLSFLETRKVLSLAKDEIAKKNIDFDALLQIIEQLEQTHLSQAGPNETLVGTYVIDETGELQKLVSEETDCPPPNIEESEETVEELLQQAEEFLAPNIAETNELQKKSSKVIDSVQSPSKNKPNNYESEEEVLAATIGIILRGIT